MKLKQRKDFKYLAVAIPPAIISNITKINFNLNDTVNNFMHSYGNDILIPFSYYFIARHWNISKIKTIGTIGILATLSEIVDSYDEHGVYDPKDFLAYATGLGLAYLLEKIRFKENEHP
ncbi:MAG: hypothetical protein QT08_C0012G0019 [archaeon GW2011_AR17]|nr:MAG: hypothetical protein QT08_C0012G0019 [archaeon GW2011_AR17]MBS3154255.1 hypothetical protein [Candidatus Woesearchaeota archaeon]HIH14865.1 hypothetical protein [Nanoarchaeota archaeon]HIH58876.1 hypothetical protein [Nanoarchaeota archaeon]HII14034.1 hypothetical protein [Nanoarchaeota archaeon]